MQNTVSTIVGEPGDEAANSLFQPSVPAKDPAPSVPTMDYPLRRLVEPHERNDVILNEYVHDSSRVQGTHLFQLLVEQRVVDYEAKDRLEKPMVAAELVSLWRTQNPPGRFLKYDAGSGLYDDVGDKRARERISKMLRKACVDGKTNTAIKPAHDSLASSKSKDDTDGAGTTELSDSEPVPERQVASSSECLRREVPARTSTASVTSRTNSELSKNDVKAPTKLYDREQEQQQLYARFEAITSRTPPLGKKKDPELVLITGASGTGKTSLALTLHTHVTGQGGYLIRGKFDQQLQERGYYPFVTAFTDYTEQLFRSTSLREIESIKESIELATFGEVNLLVQTIPALARIVGRQQHAQTFFRASEAQRRFHSVFCRFVECICSVEAPLVLFIDDIHWTNSESLDLLAALLTGSTDGSPIPGLMVLGSCRDNEVSADDHLSVKLRYLEDQQGLQLTEIPVRNLSEQAVRELVTDTIGLSSNDPMPLAKFLYSQTKGNVFFTISMLQSLLETGVLDSPSFRMKTNSRGSTSGGSEDPEQSDSGKKEVPGDMRPPESEILTIAHDDPVELMCERIKRFPKPVQDVFKTASCIGFEFEECVLEIALKDASSTTVSRARQSQLLVKIQESSRLAFAHDKVQQASYELIPKEERAAFHLAIGRRLGKHLRDSDPTMVEAGLVVRQFSHCLDSIEDERERATVAELCLAAGKTAQQSSSFNAAASHFRIGMSLLPLRHWRDCYALSLALFSSAAEVEYAVGNIDQTDALVSQVLQNARSLEDRLPAYTIRIYSQGTKHEITEAVDTALLVVAELGESFSKPTKVEIRSCRRKTERMLKNMDSSRILLLPDMKDAVKLSVMRTLSLACTYIWSSMRAEYTPLVVMRLVQLSVEHGLSAISALGFSYYAMLLCMNYGEIEEGYRYGRLALQILDKYQAREWLARIYVVVFGMINTNKTPIRDSVEPLLKAHHAGLVSGDIEFSCMALHLASFCQWFASAPLPKLKTDFVAYRRLMTQHKQTFICSLQNVRLQTVSNLLGEAADPLVLSGEFMNEDALIPDAKERKLETFLSAFYIYKSIIAFVMNVYDLAEESIEQVLGYGKMSDAVFVKAYARSVEGILALKSVCKAGSRHTRRRFIKKARSAIDYVNTCAESGPQNLLHRLYFLRAELALIEGNVDKSFSLYETAFQLAEREGLTSECAIIAEHSGLAMCGQGRVGPGMAMMRKARSLYKEWGATIKVQQLDHVCSGGH